MTKLKILNVAVRLNEGLFGQTLFLFSFYLIIFSEHEPYYIHSILHSIEFIAIYKMVLLRTMEDRVGAIYSNHDRLAERMHCMCYKLHVKCQLHSI